ncbi:MAG: response regulator, partial [Desulfobacterales bacterium]
ARADRRLKILVAEDTPFNQKFILRLLERWGYDAVLAEDGRKAVEAYAAANFDLVFMDVQMPEMDGLQAAQAIRMIEDARGGRTPIIAMTAHAIHGDRERCLGAGMDDYLSKPIDADALRKMIDRLLRPAAVAPAPGPAPAGAALPELLQGFDNDWGFFREVVEVFCKDYPQLIETLRRTADSADAPAFMRAAHSLKGMLRNFQAEPAADKAQALEQKGRVGELSGLSPLIAALAADLSSLERHLHTLLSRAPAGV